MDKLTFFTQDPEPDSIVVSLVPVRANAKSDNGLLRGSYLATVEHKGNFRAYLVVRV